MKDNEVEYVSQLEEEVKRYERALTLILCVTADGSLSDQWNGSTGGSGHALCRKIARQALEVQSK